MRLARSLAIVCALLLVTTAASAPLPAQVDAAPAAPAESPQNSDRAQAQHYVVLLSLDGFRFDYRDAAKNLLALGKHGAWAPEGMLPGFPAFSWPSQFTIVTGLYPGHNGIVADSFMDPTRQARFTSDYPKAAVDSSWYNGTPFWSLAERQGMRTACIRWAGCAAQIAGFRPTYQGREDADRGNKEPASEVRQIIAWLHLPAPERPHFIAAKFDEPGETARRFGPDAPETRAAVRRVDLQISKLRADLDATHLPIDLVVVSDRGFAKPDGGWITLDQFADLSGFETTGTLLYAKTEADRERVYNQLKKATSEFFVYRLKNLPASLNDRNDRMGDPVIVATGPYAVRVHAPAGAAGPPPRTEAPPRIVDGFDPHLVPQMKGIFCAAGPDIVEGRTVAPFESVNLYPWLAHLLGLTPPKTDGSLNILSGTLRDNGDEIGK